MRTRLGLVLGIGALLAVTGCWKPPVSASSGEQPETDAGKGESEAMAEYMSALSWLVGMWSAGAVGEEVSEEWIRVHPRLMLGSNRTSWDDELVGYEHLEIWARGRDLIYRAKPADQPAVELVLVELAEDTAVFENPAHDFPRRIVYKRKGDDLTATILGEVDGEPTEKTWKWKLGAAGKPPEYILKSVAVGAPVEEVFAAFTSERGARTFFAPDASIDARPGGAYELYFVPDAPEDSRGGEGGTVVEIAPPGRIAFTWNFPPSIPTLRDAHTLVTIQVSPLEGGQSRVDLKQEGFRTGPEWDEGRAYFDEAWGIVLERLQQRFKSGPIDWDAV